ncbi:hypothetical protein LSAT2_017422 [Lamellibrachia satsuma]|nr:hypothetical protein LSAT2_017422 [Lamellibrachia satsuma]
MMTTSHATYRRLASLRPACRDEQQTMPTNYETMLTRKSQRRLVRTDWNCRRSSNASGASTGPSISISRALPWQPISSISQQDDWRATIVAGDAQRDPIMILIHRPLPQASDEKTMH